jgi:hypothetical protein
MTDPDTAREAKLAPGKHLPTCGWFWAWAGLGAASALGLISALSTIAVAPAIIAGAVLTRIPRARQSAFGLAAGAGLLCLFVAYVQREGPGTTCWHTATAAGCDQHLNPLPWLIAGLVLFLGAFIAQSRHPG